MSQASKKAGNQQQITALRQEKTLQNPGLLEALLFPPRN
jgi:hypothetical protein